VEALLGVIGSLFIAISLVWLLINLFRRKNKKSALILFGTGFVLFFIAIAVSPEVVPTNGADIVAEAPAEEQLTEEKTERQQAQEREIALSSSRKNFEEGMNLFNEGNYGEAIEKLSLVIAEDSDNYTEAINQIAQAKKLYSQKLFEQANVLFTESKYEETISTAQKAVEINPVLSNEIEPLIQKATVRLEEITAERLRVSIIEQMSTFEGEGSTAIAVSDVIAQSSFYDGFTTWTPENPDAWYLLVAVHAMNISQSSLHVNPHYITLIHNNYVYNPDMNTYSMDNFFDAKNLQPDTRTSGWVVFLVPKADSYTLVYEGMLDRVVKKEIIVTEVR